MEAVSRVILTTMFTRFVNRHKTNLKFYQVVLQMYVDQVLALVMTKYSFYRKTIEETIEETKRKREKVALEQRLVQIKDKAGDMFVKLQSMHEECVTHEDTLELFCEPYIHSGFRPLNKPYSYYAKSIFYKHNESVNALSHYLGAFYCTTYFFRYDFTDVYTWPLLTSVLTAIAMFSTSASAHLMHPKSPYCHMTCFLFDFTGISLHLFASALIQTYYCSPTWYYKKIEAFYLPMFGFLSVSCCLSNCFAQVNYKRPYPPIKRILQFLPLAITWSVTVVPLLLLLFSNNNTANDIDLSIDFKSHAIHICLFLLGGATFGLDIPQRFFPGCVDFFGQGHHIFHICIFFVVIIQIESCYAGFMANYEHIVNTRVQPTFEMCFISVFILLIYDLFIIKKLRTMIAHNFDSEGNLLSKKVEDQIDMNGSTLL